MTSPSPRLSVAESEYDLLELLDEFSADDIADIVCAIDIEAGEAPVEQPPPSSPVQLSTQAAAATTADNGGPSLTMVCRVPAAGNRRPVAPKKSFSNSVKKKPAVPKAKPLRRNDPNKARNERKEELIYLQKKVEQLEFQLRKMRRTGPAATTTASCADSGGFSLATSSGLHTGNDSSTSVITALSPASVKVWRELANRQRTLRVTSERENIRLRLVLETQLKIAKSLEKTLLKPASAREIEKCLQDMPHASFFSHQAHQASLISRSLPSGSSDDAIFEILLNGAQQSHSEIDVVFEVNGLARMESTYKDARMRRDAQGGLYMEIFANKVLPFGIHETSDAVWHHFVFGKEKIPHRPHTENAPKVFLPSISSYLKDFGLEVHAKHKSARFRVKQVLQQHVEETKERIAIVWQARIDPVAFSDEPLLPDDIGFVEKGYIIMKRPPTLSGNLTLLQTCHHIMPNPLQGRDSQGVSATGEDGFARVGALTDFVLSATAANITTSYEIIEDVLLEQSRKKSSGAQGS